MRLAMLLLILILLPASLTAGDFRARPTIGVTGFDFLEPNGNVPFTCVGDCSATNERLFLSFVPDPGQPPIDMIRLRHLENGSPGNLAPVVGVGVAGCGLQPSHIEIADSGDFGPRFGDFFFDAPNLTAGTRTATLITYFPPGVLALDESVQLFYREVGASGFSLVIPFLAVPEFESCSEPVPSLSPGRGGIALAVLIAGIAVIWMMRRHT